MTTKVYSMTFSIMNSRKRFAYKFGSHVDMPEKFICYSSKEIELQFDHLPSTLLPYLTVFAALAAFKKVIWNSYLFSFYFKSYLFLEAIVG